MGEPGHEIMSPSGDLMVTKEEGIPNWNKLYVLVLLFNVILIAIFYLFSHFFNHLSA